MKDIILYILFQISYYLIRLMPNKFRYYSGIELGLLIYHLVKSRREITINNLKRALGDKYSDRELIELGKEAYRQMGLLMVEFIMLRDLKKEDLSSLIEIENEQYLKEAYQQGRGVIIYTAHLGNWEWLGAVISLLGYPLNATARTQKNSFFDKKINEIRKSIGAKMIPLGMSIRQAFKVLKQGELLYINGDQSARKHGWIMDFFDIPTSVYPGTVQLACRTGALILPAYLIRKEWGKHQLRFYSPLEIRKDADEEEQYKLLNRLTSITEEIIREHPEQWFWMHERWKTSRQAKE